MRNKLLIVVISLAVIVVNSLAVLGAWGQSYARKNQLEKFKSEYNELLAGDKGKNSKTKEELLTSLINLSEIDAKNYSFLMTLILISTLFSIAFTYTIIREDNSKA